METYNIEKQVSNDLLLYIDGGIIQFRSLLRTILRFSDFIKIVSLMVNNHNNWKILNH